MIQPGTWLKWYVTNGGQPIYFRFIGRLTVDLPEDVTTYVIDSQWHQRLYVNDWFLHWLLPLSENEEGQFVETKKFTPRPIPEKPKKNPMKSTPPLAAAVIIPDTNFPRLLSRTAGK